MQLGDRNLRTYSTAISSIFEVRTDIAVFEAVERVAAGGVDGALALQAASIFVADAFLEVVGSGLCGGGHSGESWNWVGQDGHGEQIGRAHV